MAKKSDVRMPRAITHPAKNPDQRESELEKLGDAWISINRQRKELRSKLFTAQQEIHALATKLSQKVAVTPTEYQRVKAELKQVQDEAAQYKALARAAVEGKR